MDGSTLGLPSTSTSPPESVPETSLRQTLETLIKIQFCQIRNGSKVLHIPRMFFVFHPNFMTTSKFAAILLCNRAELDTTLLRKSPFAEIPTVGSAGHVTVPNCHLRQWRSPAPIPSTV